jgi:hypothetical protein
MGKILQVKYYNLETGQDIPMSQAEEDKQKKKWYQKLWNWLYIMGGPVIIGIGWGLGTGGGPFVVKKITITAVDRPDPNK